MRSTKNTVTNYQSTQAINPFAFELLQWGHDGTQHLPGCGPDATSQTAVSTRHVTARRRGKHHTAQVQLWDRRFKKSV